MAGKRDEGQQENTVIDFERARDERRKRREEAAEKKRRKQDPGEKSKRPKRKTGQAARRRLVVVALAVVILIIAVFSLLNIMDLRQEQAAAQRELEALKEERDRLSEELERVASPEYIEQQARQRLHMIYPDEYLYIVPPSEDGMAEEAENPVLEQKKNGQSAAGIAPERDSGDSSEGKE